MFKISSRVYLTRVVLITVDSLSPLGCSQEAWGPGRTMSQSRGKTELQRTSFGFRFPRNTPVSQTGTVGTGGVTE